MKQQTALQTLIEWGDERMKEHPMKLLSFAEAIDKAEELLAMEREQIIDAFYQCGRDNFEHIKVINRSATQYFTDTYQTNNE